MRTAPYTPSCPLCRLWHDREIKTPFHYEDELIIIVDCTTCKVPMVVIKRHDIQVTPTESARIEEVVNRKWPGATLRCAPRRIKDHYHCHIITRE